MENLQTNQTSDINLQLKEALEKQQKIAQMVIQKDWELAKMNARLDRQVDQLKGLQKMMNNIRGINNREGALDLIAQGLVVDLQFSEVVVLLGPPPFKLGVKYSYKEIEQIENLVQHPLTREAYNKILIVRDSNQASPPEKELVEILHLTSFCLLPLQLRETSYGVFICGLDDPYQRLNESDIEFLEIVANSISITLEGLTIEERVQQSLVEQQRISQMVIQKDLELATINDQLDKQIVQLKILQERMNKIRTINDPKQALDLIAQGLVMDLYFSGVVILLGHPPFKIGVKYSYKEIDLDQLRQDPLISRTYRERKPTIVQNINDTSSEEKELGLILHLTSFCVLPLQVKKRYGLFICGLDDPYQKLTGLDIEFLEIMASSISITLESMGASKRRRLIERMKSEFVSIASHQLRTPLSVVKWILKMCLDGDLGELTREQKNFLEMSYDSNQRMIDLVNDLLDVSRIEEGRLDYKFSNFDLVQLLKDVITQFQVLIKDKRLELETNIEEYGELIMNGDREKLSLAFNNLIDNAVKYTPPHKRIGVHLREEGGRIQVIVSDTGIGISKRDQQRLFTKFFRAESAQRLKISGSGLGLFICKNIIEKHHGKITIESALGQGSTFICEFARDQKK